MKRKNPVGGETQSSQKPCKATAAADSGGDDGVFTHFLSPLSREALRREGNGVITPFMKKILQEHEHTQGVDLRKKNAKEVVEHIMQRKRIFLSYYLKIVCMRLEGEIMLHEAATAADDASSP